jgi:hypothetical protein
MEMERTTSSPQIAHRAAATCAAAAAQCAPSSAVATGRRGLPVLSLLGNEWCRGGRRRWGRVPPPELRPPWERQIHASARRGGCQRAGEGAMAGPRSPPRHRCQQTTHPWDGGTELGEEKGRGRRPDSTRRWRLCSLCRLRHLRRRELALPLLTDLSEREENSARIQGRPPAPSSELHPPVVVPGTPRPPGRVARPTAAEEKEDGEVA